MALADGTLFEIRATATTGNTGGSGFNTANANFVTDLTATSATGNAPVVSSATYTFVSGDTNAWLYVKSGTNWTPGFYQITSVSAGAATLNATIGAATQLSTVTNLWGPSTVAGCATTASPTAGTFGIDYSQQDSAQTTATDFTSVGASTTLSSATAAFTRMMVGNFFHQTTTGTGAHGLTNWFEIVSYTNATTVTLDRTPNDGTASVACTGFVGGSGRLNGLEDAFYEMIPSASTVFVKSGTYTLSASISVASTNSTAQRMSVSIGYTSARGDTCNNANRPTLACGSNFITFGQAQSAMNFIVTGTATNVLSTGANSYTINVKVLNTSTTAARVALFLGTSFSIFNCELVSQNGNALSTSNTGRIHASYVHDSNNGISASGGTFSCTNTIFEAMTSSSVNYSSITGVPVFINNTFYGREAKMGTGLNFSGVSVPSMFVANNIFYGFSTAVSVGTAVALSNLSEYNDYFNNTTDATNWFKMPSDIAVNPQFVGASQITGSTATTSGSTLTQSGGAFGGVNDNVDYLHVVSGTGVTTGVYLITGHTTTTLTVNNALGTSSGGDVVYFITNGHNFAVGTNLKATGFPGVFPGGLTTGYMDIGAAQRQESGGTVAYTFS